MSVLNICLSKCWINWRKNLKKQSTKFKLIKLIPYLAYLDTEDVNVIVVDWEYGASYNYLAARGHAATTGKHLGKFISLLKKNFNVSLKNVRLVGHSLGSHVSGFAGKTVKKITGNKVAQIVGKILNIHVYTKLLILVQSRLVRFLSYDNFVICL